MPTHQEDSLYGATDEEDGEEQDTKVDKHVCAYDADDLPQEVDGKHAVDAHHYQEQCEGNPVPTKEGGRERLKTWTVLRTQIDKESFTSLLSNPSPFYPLPVSSADTLV